MAGRGGNPTLVDLLSNAAFRAVIGVAMALPYDRRVAFVGWVTSHVIAPLAGYRVRVRANLALVRPDLSAKEVRRLARAVPDNAGRSLIEIYSGSEFKQRIAASDPLEGPGLAELEAAQAEGRPVIIAVAHLGNYDAMRAALVARGLTVGAVYRPMENQAFNVHYIKAISAIAEPLFPRNRAGVAAMIRFLRDGGMLALGTDQHFGRGAELLFFGKPAMTTLAPAELALKHDCPLIPIHSIRQDNGLDFRVRVDAPIPHSTPEAMMQQVNDNLEAVVRAHMDQWFWIHRRWKGGATAKDARPVGQDPDQA